MADIQDGFSLTLKQGTDLFTIQGVTYESFVANLEAVFGKHAEEVLARYIPVTPEEAEAILKAAPLKAAPAPAVAAKPAQAAAAPVDDPATPKQKDFIWKVAKENGLERADVLALAAKTVGRDIGNLNDISKREASLVIDAIKGA